MNIVVREATDADAGLIAEQTRRAWAGKVDPLEAQPLVIRRMLRR